MLAIRLPEALEQRLADLARRTGRSKTFYARQAIETHLDDLEDVYLADLELQRVREGESPTYSLEEVMRAHGLED
jgi:RHH-type rel operon transcriptional repressor/antitoxin RelB